VDRVVAHIAVRQGQGIQADAAIVERQGHAGIETVTTYSAARGRRKQRPQGGQLETDHARLCINRRNTAAHRAHPGDGSKMGGRQLARLFQLERDRHRRWIAALFSSNRRSRSTASRILVNGNTIGLPVRALSRTVIEPSSSRILFT
jgi:hypothetical protein